MTDVGDAEHGDIQHMQQQIVAPRPEFGASAVALDKT
jgi:hypothetical protein